jgi:Holliday junction resolvase RusA-like endonuclease
MTVFTVLGLPSTKGSTRSFLRGKKIVTVADARGLGAWTQAVKWAAKVQAIKCQPKPIPMSIAACFVFTRPASAPLRPHHVVKPDLDKMLRALLDALTGIAYEDDAQVTLIAASKAYGPEAKTEVTVRTV